jgi:hypothetical protein
MLNHTIIGLCAGFVALVGATLSGLAQDMPKPAQTETKAIGVPSNASAAALWLLSLSTVLLSAKRIAGYEAARRNLRSASFLERPG